MHRDSKLKTLQFKLDHWKGQTHPSRGVINNFIEITLQHGCSVNLRRIFRITFPKNTYDPHTLAIRTAI